MERLQEFVRKLRDLESQYGVEVFAKGISYGAARLMITDFASDESHELEDIEHDR